MHFAAIARNCGFSNWSSRWSCIHRIEGKQICSMEQNLQRLWRFLQTRWSFHCCLFVWIGYSDIARHSLCPLSIQENPETQSLTLSQIWEHVSEIHHWILMMMMMMMECCVVCVYVDVVSCAVCRTRIHYLVFILCIYLFIMWQICVVKNVGARIWIDLCVLCCYFWSFTADAFISSLLSEGKKKNGLKGVTLCDEQNSRNIHFSLKISFHCNSS